jgi:ribosome-associated protein
LTKLIQQAQPQTVYGLSCPFRLIHHIKPVRLLEPLSVLQNRAKSSVTRLSRNSRIFKTIVKAIQDKKGEEIISLDLRKIPEASADFFVVCQASSTTQIKAIADYVENEVKEKCGEMPYKHEGRQALQWVLIDYVNIVVHVMHPEARKFYKLEEMWSDAASQLHEA